jgi:hypothetical protein
MFQDLYLGFVLTGYGKVTDVYTTMYKTRVYYLQFPKKRAWHATRGYMEKNHYWSGGRRNEVKAQSKPFITTIVEFFR